jgi:hypothetical protein
MIVTGAPLPCRVPSTAPDPYGFDICLYGSEDSTGCENDLASGAETGHRR